MGRIRVLGALAAAVGLLVGVWVGREWEQRSWDRQRYESFMESCRHSFPGRPWRCDAAWLESGGR